MNLKLTKPVNNVIFFHESPVAYFLKKFKCNNNLFLITANFY